MTMAHNHSGNMLIAQLDYQQIFPFIVTANTALFRYVGLSSAILNAYVLLSLHITQQVDLSSVLKDSQVTISDMFEFNYESCVSYFIFHETQKLLRLISDTQHKP